MRGLRTNLFIFKLFTIFLILCTFSTGYAFALPHPKSPKTVRILALDGGGIKSIITLKILDYIETKTGKRTTELFDLISGTSSGGLMSLYFSIPDENDPTKSKYSAAEIIKLVEEDAQTIFKPRPLSRVIGKRTVQLFKPAYPRKNIETAMENRFQDLKMSDAPGNALVISFDTQVTKPFCFKTYDKKVSHALMKDAGMATSISPFYFDPVLFKDNENREHTLIDGGLAAKNPSMYAYTEAKLLYPNAKILLVSLGAGYQQKERYSYNRMQGWGFVRFILPTIVFMLDGTANANSEYIEKLTTYDKDDKYVRLQPVYHKKYDKFNNEPDDTSKDNLENLNRIADQYIQDHRKELDELVKLIEESEKESL